MVAVVVSKSNVNVLYKVENGDDVKCDVKLADDRVSLNLLDTFAHAAMPSSGTIRLLSSVATNAVAVVMFPWLLDVYHGSAIKLPVGSWIPLPILALLLLFTGWVAGWLADRLVGWLVLSFVRSFVAWLLGCLVTWLLGCDSDFMTQMFNDETACHALPGICACVDGGL
uniref:Uncharacterized protein n=1 Tax=Glossina brevipalpis TaxID=37001 RepID=A0A1A9WVF8_9MUSC